MKYIVVAMRPSVLGLGVVAAQLRERLAFAGVRQRGDLFYSFLVDRAILV